MKKRFSSSWLVLLACLLAGARLGLAQDVSRLPGNVYQRNDCYPTPGSVQRNAADKSTGNQYNPNGAMVTARGELHVLVIYAGFYQ